MSEFLRPGTKKQRCTAAAATANAASFRLGSVYATPGALEMLEKYQVSAATLLERHQSGDFGHVGADSVRDNLLAIAQGLRVLSAYRLLDSAALVRMTAQELRRVPTIWCITEADRSSTTLLVPSEY